MKSALDIMLQSKILVKTVNSEAKRTGSKNHNFFLSSSDSNNLWQSGRYTLGSGTLILGRCRKAIRKNV